VNTFGFLVGEVLRRTSGQTVGDLLRAEVAGPLGADVHISLPAAEHGRVAEFAWPGLPDQRQDLAELADHALMEHNAYFNPLGLSGAGVVNSAAWRQAELPSTNGHGTARGVARVYAALAAGGRLDGVAVVPSSALADATAEQVYGDDLVLHRPSRFGLGFQLTQPERPIGPNTGVFGHFGAGGSLGFCDPQAGIGFGYVVGRMGPRWQNPANRALLEALYSCL
jgi:CubicO group peptidase (beta-lactamase class C family)